MNKIMVVEDDPMLVEIYEKKLLDSGFEVKVVTSGAAVKDEMLAWKPNLLLLDVVLPDMDGFEILEGIKNEPEIKNTTIYILSNLSSKEDTERALGLGAAGFLTKSSYTPTQLVEEVKKILNHPVVPVQEKPESGAKQQEEIETKIEKKEKNGHKILIIEDEDVFIQMFGDKLKAGGFDVVSAKNGRWGLKEAETGDYNCILLDMMMPTMNGYEATKELRANEKTKNVPIIILSNSAQDSEVKKALDLGANAYYVKTQITPGEVVEEVKRLIKESLK